MRRATLAVALLAGSLALSGSAAADPSPVAESHAKTTTIQILGFNDFHGNLVGPTAMYNPSFGNFSSSTGTVPVGGVEFFAAHVRALRATNPNTTVVSAGDLIGASPLISALFHDEPTIEAMNLLGLDLNGVGNHEFDEGVDELLRMQFGGCHPVDGCQDGDGFAGATFRMLAANVTYKATGDTIFPAYEIVTYDPGDIKIAYVGMTLEGTPQIVTPAGISHVDFHDEAASVNALVPELKAQGVETIVVLLHQGGSIGRGTINDCNNPSGPLPPIVDAMDDEVDVVVTGHTNWAVNCVIDGKIVTGASAFGRLVTDIDLTISRASKDVVSAAVENKLVTRDVEPAADLQALVAKYDALSAPLANRVIGSITGDITRDTTTAGESALGDVIADAQLDATDDPGFGSAVIAFMNPGGIRANLVASQISGGEAVGEVTYGEAFSVQPFGNSLVTMTLTGSQIEQLLEQQWCAGDNVNRARILQVSQGFTYSYDGTGFDATGVGNPGKNVSGDCDRIDPTTMRINGIAVDPLASYRVTVNSFIADGGDSFSVLKQGTDRLGGDVDLDALDKYFQARAAVAPGPRNRIART